MKIELWALFGCVVILFLSILFQGTYLDLTSGIKYALSSRAEAPPNQGPMGARLDRNVRNQVEGLALFAPLVLIAGVAEISTGLTQTAAIVVVMARALYVPAYAFDWSPFRNLFWMGSFFGSGAFAFGILSAAGLPF